MLSTFGISLLMGGGTVVSNTYNQALLKVVANPPLED